MANQNLSPMQNEKNDEDDMVFQDPCPVCKEELYLDNEYTQRIGLLDDLDEVVRCAAAVVVKGAAHPSGLASGITFFVV